LITETKYTTQDILKGIAQSDNKIINHLYTENFRTIRHLIVSNNGNESDAQDVFQETLVVLFSKVSKEELELTCSLNTYLYSIARNIWIKELSKRKRRPQALETDENFLTTDQSITDVIELNERLRLYRNKFEELSDDCKKVLRMFLNNVPIKEITLSMGYSSDQHTKNRRFRCKKSLVHRIVNSSIYKELGYEKNNDY
jgi:RNA polymerase sigma factor (sigma-70 family)